MKQRKKLRRLVFSTLAVIGGLILGPVVYHRVVQLGTAPTLYVPPVLSQTAPLDLATTHWQGLDGPFVLIRYTEHARVSPNETAARMSLLAATRRVQLRFKTPVTVLPDGQRMTWVLVSAPGSDAYLGWIPTDQVLAKPAFKPSKTGVRGTLSYRKGQLVATASIAESGRWDMAWMARGDGLELVGRDTGQVMSADDMIWLQRDSKRVFVDMFQQADNDAIQHEYRYRGDRIRFEASPTETTKN